MKVVWICAALLLSGCAAAPYVGVTAAGGAAGWFATAQTVNKDADAVLALDRPVKEELCQRWLAKPHAATLTAWCANLPTNTEGLALQWAAVAKAKIEEDAAP